MAIFAGSCGGAADGSIESCSTSFTGTFGGGDSGFATGRLFFFQDAWYFELTFCSQDDDCSDPESYWDCSESFPTPGCLYAIDANGAISTPTGFPRVTGTLDFDTCESEGTWLLSDNTEGTWTMRDPAL